MKIVYIVKTKLHYYPPCISQIRMIKKLGGDIEVIYGTCDEKSRKSQFFSYKIYWNYYHLLLCDRIFLARWIRVDNQLYIHLLRCCHVWHGAYNQDGRF
mgnify:CR=1 FL=1